MEKIDLETYRVKDSHYVDIPSSVHCSVYFLSKNTPIICCCIMMNGRFRPTSYRLIGPIQGKFSAPPDYRKTQLENHGIPAGLTSGAEAQYLGGGLSDSLVLFSEPHIIQAGFLCGTSCSIQHVFGVSVNGNQRKCERKFCGGVNQQSC
jgi:hypothetical protein